jgi:small neutral amino acid transporter SnatA (MarC family)
MPTAERDWNRRNPKRARQERKRPVKRNLLIALAFAVMFAAGLGGILEWIAAALLSVLVAGGVLYLFFRWAMPPERR